MLAVCLWGRGGKGDRGCMCGDSSSQWRVVGLMSVCSPLSGGCDLPDGICAQGRRQVAKHSTLCTPALVDWATTPSGERGRAMESCGRNGV